MQPEANSRAARAALYAALGDPGRLGIAEELLVGDRSPSELAAACDLPSNLLAHHLRVLEAAGVVERTRSEADRRRTYVRLVPSALEFAWSGAQLTAPRVVFVCAHNSARSQLAMWSHHSSLPVASAGTHPTQRVHRRAVSVARRHGLSQGWNGWLCQLHLAPG